jgi:hypothetical protein
MAQLRSSYWVDHAIIKFVIGDNCFQHISAWNDSTEFNAQHVRASEFSVQRIYFLWRRAVEGETQFKTNENCDGLKRNRRT